MTIQKEFIVRYRSNGHVRFQVPERISSAAFAKTLEDRLARIDGVVQVKLFYKQHKLSIRFNEARCSFMDLAKQLSTMLNTLERDVKLLDKTALNTALHSKWRTRVNSKLETLKMSQWIKGKYGDAKETVQAAKIITKLGMKRPSAFVRDPEQAIIDFLNDVLILYLIKIHWRRVTLEWIPKPFQHRYEWLAVWYLFFLWIRSRKPKK